MNHDIKRLCFIHATLGCCGLCLAIMECGHMAIAAVGICFVLWMCFLWLHTLTVQYCPSRKKNWYTGRTVACKQKLDQERSDLLRQLNLDE